MILTAVTPENIISKLEFQLAQDYPNPFKRKIKVRYQLPCDSRVTIIITDSFGRVLDKIICIDQKAGSYKFDFYGNELPCGTYFCHLVADKFSQSLEMELDDKVFTYPLNTDE